MALSKVNPALRSARPSLSKRDAARSRRRAALRSRRAPLSTIHAAPRPDNASSIAVRVALREDIAGFLDALERQGTMLDIQTYSYLTGTYLPSSRGVPHAFWDPLVGQAHLAAGRPGSRFDTAGCRTAVRVG